ncbi:MAG TPA: SCO family protein [Anaeromyxobacteraceae bacterium]|nr:SCO family protein [Anaeromyxobacteraceae bacterium]
MRARNRAAAALAALLAALPATGEGPASPEPPCHGPAGAAPGAAPAAPQAAAETAIQFPDVELLDQDGRPVRFGADVLAGRIVVMDFVFTTCTTVCPVLNAIMGRVQGTLPALGQEVAMVTVSVDPARDTPARLKALARKLGAGPGWTWLTGEQESVKQVLKAAGAWTPSFQDHPPMVLVGDTRTGTWTRMNGFPSVERIAARAEGLLSARRTTAAAGGR